jgi:hypothetical protein
VFRPITARGDACEQRSLAVVRAGTSIGATLLTAVVITACSSGCAGETSGACAGAPRTGADPSAPESAPASEAAESASTTTSDPQPPDSTSAPPASTHATPSQAPEPAARGPSFPASVSADGRRILDHSGQPWLMVGDAGWSMVGRLPLPDVERYLDRRAAQGFNTVLVSAIEGYFSTDPPADAAGNRPFDGEMFVTEPNEPYWAGVDRIADAAAARGITLLLVPLYLGNAGEGIEDSVDGATDADLAAFGEFLGARYADRPNIIWAIGGDQNPDDATRDRLISFVGTPGATGLRRFAPQLITAHTGPNSSALEVWPDSDFVQIENVYSYSGAIAATRDAVATANCPVFFMEGKYENEQDVGLVELRTQLWGSFLSGAFGGHVFGNNPIWHFGMPVPPALYPYEGSWQDAIDSDGARDVTVFATFMSTVPWWMLVADTEGAFVERSDDVAAAWSSGLGLAYGSFEGGVDVDLGAFDSAEVAVGWLDPIAGTIEQVGIFPTTGVTALPAPGQNAGGDSDHVLVVTSVEAPA